jgi:hypothetical protein
LTSEDRRSELLVLQLAAELQQRRGVGHLLARQVDADELAHGLAVVDGILQALVAQAVPLLQEVHAQHARHTDRRAAHPAALGVVRFDQRFKPRPGNHAFHLAEELLAPRLALLACVLQAGKAALSHASIIAGPARGLHRA